VRNEAKYIEFFLPWLHGEPNADDEWRAYCPLHEDPATSKSPSASFNFDEGLWHCQSCTEGGAITHLYEKMAGENVVDIKSRKKRGDVTTKPLPSAAQIDRWHEALVGNITKLRFMNQKRGLSVQTLKRFKVGWDGYRFTIPIYDEDDNLVNIRRYKPNAKDANDKMISWGVGWGEARIYGFETLEANERVLLAEGELDRIIAVQEGLPAVTHTGVNPSRTGHNDPPFTRTGGFFARASFLYPIFRISSP
jgi:hypothetical protein